jgi:23S rRNA pseudouridine1911/1915/1917 synthase
VADEELVVVVDAPRAGMRIDRLLAERFPQHSRSRFQKLCRDGCVTAGGRKVRSAYRVLFGDEIHVRVPPLPPVDLAPEDIPLHIVHEDVDLLVVDKPAGLVVHPAAGNWRGTLVHGLLGRQAQLTGAGAPLRPGIVHRLDKDTSGLLVVAKSERAHQALAVALRDREVRREYVALVWGRMPDPAGTIDAPMGRNPSDRKRMAVVARGKPALTRWRVRQRFEPLATLLDVHLATGRTHQIRVHLASIGHPVFGDPVYGGRQGQLTRLPAPLRVVARLALARLPRQALHAARLAFRHPVTGADLQFESPLPEDIAQTLAILGQEAAGARA